MKKSLLQNLSYEDQTFFNEHLRRTAIELYEWSLVLYYFWLSNLVHYKTRQVSGTPDDDRGAQYLCEEHSKALIASGRYVRESVIHDPKIHSFPPKFDDFTRLSIKRKWDAEFHKVSQDNLEDFSGSPYFPKNAEKEYAIMYLLGNHFPEAREDVPLETKNSFHLLSIEARCLSIIYEHFSEFRKTLNWLDWDLYIEIHSLKEDVIGDCHELIGYWKLTDIKKKIQAAYGRKGGKAPKKNEAILSSIIALLIQEDKQNWPASKLWTHFKCNHCGENRATEDLVYFKKDLTWSGQDELIEEGLKKGITFNTFRSYVNLAKKKNLRQK